MACICHIICHHFLRRQKQASIPLISQKNKIKNKNKVKLFYSQESLPHWSQHHQKTPSLLDRAGPTMKKDTRDQSPSNTHSARQIRSDQINSHGSHHIQQQQPRQLLSATIVYLQPQIFHLHTWPVLDRPKLKGCPL